MFTKDLQDLAGRSLREERIDRLGVFLLQYSLLANVLCIIIHCKCMKMNITMLVVKIRNISKAVLRPQYNPWPLY